MPYLLKFLLVIVSVTLCDVCWTMYFLKTQERKAVQAGLWSSAIMMFGAIGISNYVEDKSLIIAGCIGAFLGTYLTIRFKKEEK